MSKKNIVLVLVLIVIGVTTAWYYSTQSTKDSKTSVDKISLLSPKGCELSTDIEKIKARSDLNPGMVKNFENKSYICPIEATTPALQTPAEETKNEESTCCSEEQILASYQEQLAAFNYDKTTTDTYNSLAHGFSFDYPKGWALKQGVKLEYWNSEYIYAVVLTNTKDFPLRKKEEIRVLLSPKDSWMDVGGMGFSEIFIKLTSLKDEQPMYMSVHHKWGIGEFYERADDKAYLEKFYAEGEKANDAFMTVAKSLRPF